MAWPTNHFLHQPVDNNELPFHVTYVFTSAKYVWTYPRSLHNNYIVLIPLTFIPPIMAPHHIKQTATTYDILPPRPLRRCYCQTKCNKMYQAARSCRRESHLSIHVHTTGTTSPFSLFTTFQKPWTSSSSLETALKLSLFMIYVSHIFSQIPQFIKSILNREALNGLPRSPRVLINRRKRTYRSSFSPTSPQPRPRQRRNTVSHL